MLSATALVALCGLMMTLPPAVPPAHAQGQGAVRSFSIPAQPLASAINVFGHQSGLQVTVAAGAAGGIRSSAVNGAFAPDQALGRLLAGTGLSYRITRDGTAVIGKQAPAEPAVAADGSILLDTITVTGRQGRTEISGSGYQGTPDWVYESPSAVSVVSREAIQSHQGARDPRDLLDNAAGAYVNNSVANSPAISPNIRGVQDMGRVVLSIDGARQNANRTVTAGSDSYVGSSGKGYVDTAFIRAVEVDRATGARGGLAGSLAGAVTFRTVGADDLIQSVRNWGIETNTTLGTNNQHFQGSVLGAARLGATPFSVLAGLSHQNLGEYRVGRHGEVEWVGAGSGKTSLMGRDNLSSLLKLEGDFGDVQTSLSWMHQNKTFGWDMGSGMNDEEVNVDTVTASLDWKPADNDLIDLRSSLWMNNAREETLRHARLDYPDTQIEADFLSFGFNIDNTSKFDTKLGGVSLNYGVEAFRDRSKSSATNAAITAWPELENNFTSFSPAGRRDIASGFISGEWEPADWVTLSAGVRYDWYRLKGAPTYYSVDPAFNYTATCKITEYDHRMATNPGSLTGAPAALIRALKNRCGETHGNTFYRSGSTIPELSKPETYPGTTLDIDRSDGAWLPSAMVEFKPVDWFRPYVSYSQSYRPPAIAEAFFTGGLPSTNQPQDTYAPNENLEPETARTWEIGANISLDGIATEQDSLRLKISAFQRKIEDFIVIGNFYPGPGSQQYLGYVNAIDPTRMRGVEIEGNYDTGRFWIGGSATWLTTEWPRNVQSVWYGQTLKNDNIQMFAADVPPKFKGTIDAGVRFFEEKLAIGARLTHVTPTLTQIVPVFDPDGGYLTNEYTKLDLYGSYRVNDNATLRFGLDNVTDINHVPAGSRYPAPGRTFFASLSTRF
ncbi:TonB-dependent heme/hemoglobin receptor family protein [Brucella endophytica]|uniref:Heme transporter BhuA n=2 Tax=Brucella endophytica TaxID=1963359 RepID=A0A916S9S5_9HYPH|nr:TonB-dependent heme/hemoglobin receptor family protein [Brucella endophytica]